MMKLVTYIATGDGWLYLAVISDLHSRAVNQEVSRRRGKGRIDGRASRFGDTATRAGRHGHP